MTKLLTILLFAPLLSIARQVPDSVVKEMQKQKEFLYANDPSYWTKPKPRDNSGWDKFFEFMFTSPIMHWVAYGIVVLIVVVILYQVIKVNQFSFFRKKNKKKGDGAADEEELSMEDIDRKLREAIEGNAYRPAVRYLYLKTLHQLNEKEIIKLHAKSTNHEYLRQMRNSANYNDFAHLTSIYEYVWYGQLEPGAEQFEKIHNSFNRFISAN